MKMKELKKQKYVSIGNQVYEIREDSNFASGFGCAKINFDENKVQFWDDLEYCQALFKNAKEYNFEDYKEVWNFFDEYTQGDELDVILQNKCYIVSAAEEKFDLERIKVNKIFEAWADEQKKLAREKEENKEDEE